jgi:DNA-damage-inducible protein D
MENTHLIPLEGKNIRKVWHDEQWYFSVVDVIEVLTNSPNPSRYWADLKRRSEKETGDKVFAFCEPLKMQTAGGKQNVICAHTEGILRIAMSVPSPKAEPLKLWLAEQGKRTIDETENPELLTERQAEIYKAKGYSEEWILRRMQTIDTRKQLTDEWKNRGVKEGPEYSILTATIAKGTFGLSPSEHSQLKGLKNENLRDHMTPLELILTALGEEVTRTIAVDENAQGFEENHYAAVKGGEVGKKALKNVEAATKKKVISKENYLNRPKTAGELPNEK